MSTAEPLDPLAAIAGFGLAGRPDPKVDRALDATERCLARHGIRRTTMSDIAKEMGVSRPTLYKHLSSVEEAVALVASRQLYAILDQVQALLAQGAGPETFIEMAVQLISFVRTDPVTQRVLTYEPDLVGALITSGQLTGQLNQVLDLVTPLLQTGMDAGTIRAGDARLTAELIVRLCGTLILAPTGSDLEDLIRYGLEPLLVPPTTTKHAKSRR